MTGERETHRLAPLESVLLDVARKTGMRVGERSYDEDLAEASEIDDVAYPIKTEQLKEMYKKARSEEIPEKRVLKILSLSDFVEKGLASKHQLREASDCKPVYSGFTRKICPQKSFLVQPAYNFDYSDSKISCSRENVNQLISSGNYCETISLYDEKEDCEWSITRNPSNCLKVSGPLISSRERKLDPLRGFDGMNFDLTQEMLRGCLSYAIKNYLRHLLDE